MTSNLDDLQQGYLGQLRRVDAAAAAATKSSPLPTLPQAVAEAIMPEAVPGAGAGGPSWSAPPNAPPGAVSAGTGAASAGADGESPAIDNRGGLGGFSRMLAIFTHHSKLKVIAAIPRSSTRQSSSILSSIEFDRDSTAFATAGAPPCLFFPPGEETCLVIRTLIHDP